MIDYKKIIRSRKLRLAILRFLSFVPDKWMIKLQYRIKLGRRLNLKNPKRFTEKLQWYKLFYRDPLMPKCADKGDVREYVASCGLNDILNECYGIFDRVEDIDFNKLPNSFVAKNTLGGGGNSVVIVKDKEKLDIPALKARMSTWVKGNAHRKDAGREWAYTHGRKHGRIIIEKYIESDESEGGLIDYKFFCFNGKAEYMYVVADREIGNAGGLSVLDANYNLLPYTRSDERPLERSIKKPENFEKLKIIAERLSSPFPHARIDMYDQDSKILFGEITFFDGSGYYEFYPDEFDFIMGEKFILPEKNRR